MPVGSSVCYVRGRQIVQCRSSETLAFLPRLRPREHGLHSFVFCIDSSRCQSQSRTRFQYSCLGTVLDLNLGHTLICNPCPTLEFHPSPVFKFGPDLGGQVCSPSRFQFLHY
ncbi:hypothetical protein EVAR_4089_1 [Eumeta japonica]|uniref:Uncharacterized protein n=1 Tax=Eumeta variegata TaxID=151549 RepID=A0A4C1T542_EUMVA|nr:hypothetical protein EVAR_4089_1 [Eumeta japonica]